MTDASPEEFGARYRRYLCALVLFHLITADEVGLSGTDFQASNALELDGPLLSGELAQRLGLTTGAATRLIDRMVDAGYARRVSDPADRRRVLVEHTRTPDRLQELLSLVREPIGGALAAMTPEQREGVELYLAASTAAYREAAATVRGTGATSIDG